MALSEAELLLAEHCYGYGRWCAPYWFIGPEQGGNEKEVPKRAEAFRKLNTDGLCDCRLFHKEIYEPGKRDWFRQQTLPPLQPTWHCLMLTLKSYQGEVGLEKPTNKASLRLYQVPFRKYQRDCWGSHAGETCVIELSGLPAKNFSQSRTRVASLSSSDKDHLEKLEWNRANTISQRIRDVKPELVVVYSSSQWGKWKALQTEGTKLSQTSGGIFRLGRTLVAFTESHGKSSPGHGRWLRLGLELRGFRNDPQKA